MIGGGWAVRTRVELVFAFDATSAMSAKGRHANAAPCEAQMDGCTFGRDDQLQVLGAEKKKWGVSGAGSQGCEWAWREVQARLLQGSS